MKNLITLFAAVLLSSCSTEPSQEVETSEAEEYFHYKLGNPNYGIPYPSRYANYYKLTTNYEDLVVEDYGTAKEIDSLKPIRIKEIVKHWDEYSRIKE